MSLLTGTNLAKSYGPDDIFAGLDVALPHGARAGLVGPNGAGKTTLLRLLAGLEEPSAGVVQRARGVRLGYLQQEAALASEGTLWEEMLTAFNALRSREAELARLETAMADPGQFAAVMERYGPLQHQFELDGGYLYETRIKQVLGGLNLTPDDYDKPVAILSGGQKTRALLARLLLEQPDLLVLDEPTNHLDIHAVEWLETWLNDWDGAVLVVSHDRYFLDQVVNTVWELEFGRVEEYHGNYSAYLVQRSDRREAARTEFAAQQAFIAKEQDYIRRNIAGQNTKQARGRRARLERLFAGRDPNQTLAAGPRDGGQIKIDLRTSLRSGDRVIETEALAVGYRDDGKVLFRAPRPAAVARRMRGPDRPQWRRQDHLPQDPAGRDPAAGRHGQARQQLESGLLCAGTRGAGPRTHGGRRGAERAGDVARPGARLSGQISLYRRRRV